MEVVSKKSGDLNMERVKGIEPSRPAWKAGALPIEPHSYAVASIQNHASRTMKFMQLFFLLPTP